MIRVQNNLKEDRGAQAFIKSNFYVVKGYPKYGTFHIPKLVPAENPEHPECSQTLAKKRP